MKKFLIFLILIHSFSFTLFAQQSHPGVRVIDGAGLLSGTVISELERKTQEIAETYNIDLVIVTAIDTDGKSPETYADNFLEDNGYNLDSCILLQVTRDRDYVFSTSGRAIKLLYNNNAAFNKLESRVGSYLRNDDSAGAFRTYLNIWEEFLVLESKGRSYNFFHEWNVVLVIAAWVISLLIGVIVVTGWKKIMNTALPKKEADSFIVPGSLAFTTQNDRFLYSTVSKTVRESSNIASSLGSGKGGFRTSSSGRSFGGRSGKY